MSVGLKELIDHDLSEDCPVCRAHDVVEMVLVPAAAAWELKNQLPRFSIALHGAAGLLGPMLEEGVPRHEIESALGQLLEEIERQIAEDQALGGPPQGNA